MSTNEMTFADRAVAVARALPAYAHLPALRAMTARNDSVSLSIDSTFLAWDAVEKLSKWAYAFSAEVTVSLSWTGGAGEVKTSFVLGGSTAEIVEMVTSAQAYAMGTLMQKPISKDAPLTLTAAELQELLPKLSAVTA